MSCNRGPRGRPGLRGPTLAITKIPLSIQDNKSNNVTIKLPQVNQIATDLNNIECTYLYYNSTPDPPLGIADVQRTIYITKEWKDGSIIILKDTQILMDDASPVELLIDVGSEQRISDGTNAGSSQAILKRDPLHPEIGPFAILQRAAPYDGSDYPTWIATTWRAEFSSSV